MACPTWAPNIAPPSWRTIPSIGPASADISAGRSAGRAPGSASAVAATTFSATGSTKAFHAGSVPSTHWARLQASAPLVPAAQAGRLVEPDLGEAARRPRPRPAGQGSAPGRRPWLRQLWPGRAARSQFTGPPVYDMSCPIWAKAAPRSFGFPPKSAANGLSASDGSGLRSGSSSPDAALNPNGKSFTGHLGQDGWSWRRTPTPGSAQLPLPPTTLTGPAGHRCLLRSGFALGALRRPSRSSQKPSPRAQQVRPRSSRPRSR